MRQTIAAACAAVLVGLAPAGAFACVSFGAAAGDAVACAPLVQRGVPAVAAVEVRISVASVSTAAGAREPGQSRPTCSSRAIWRAPSGPAPSQAPPAAAALS